MSPLDWAIRPLKKYAQFSGRAPRAEFWWFFLAMTVVYLAMWMVFGIFVGGFAAGQTEPSAGFLGAIGVAGIFMVIFWLALLIPIIAVQTRRLHDTNRSGFWLVGYYLLYLVYMVLTFGMLGSAMSGAMAGQTEPTAGFGSMIAVIGIVGLFFFVYSIVLLVFYCLPGTKGSNKYGSDPYGDDIEQVFA